MKLWVKILSAAVPGGAILLLAVLFFRWCCHRCRQHPSPTPTPTPTPTPAPFTETGAKYRNDSLQSALSKLHLSYKSNSSKASVKRFHQLHHKDDHHHHHQQQQQQQQQILQQGPPFNWDDHPRFIAEAVEHGWSRFAFRNPSSSSAPRSASLLGLCTVCDSGQTQEASEIKWEVPLGSSEFMQTVRLNPGSSNSSSCSVRMSLPLPGPPLGGSSFPQEAYFEITILYLQPQRHPSPRPSKRVRDGEGDRAKLIREDSMESNLETIALSPIKEPKEEQGKHQHPVISLGLTMRCSPTSKSMLGAYPGSISFNSNGSVCLDGMNLVLGTERAEWGGVNRVIGCGFNPGKKKVFLTVDSELAHVIQCSSEVFKSPLYPVLAVANADVMVLVNLGQSSFKYGPANAHRTRNPCFLRSPSIDNAAAVSGFADSRELFSMGRIDSEWVDAATRRSNRKKSNGTFSDGSVALDVDDDEADLFEIVLHR